MRGVKGVECQALTEEINKALGEVYESKPTQEMFEQEVQVNVDNEISVSESWSGSSTVRAATPSLCAACARHAPLIDASSHGPGVPARSLACAVGQRRQRQQRRW